MAPDDFSLCQADLDRFETEAVTGPELDAMPASFNGIAGSGYQKPVLYSVPCPRPFYETAWSFAAAKGEDLSDLVRMALVLMAPAIRDSFSDPGNGLGVAALPPPVLKLRLEPGLDHRTIRQTVAAVLALASPDWRLTEIRERERFAASVDRVRERNRTLRTAMDCLAFEPTEKGPETLEDALAIMGLLGGASLDKDRIAQRFRTLARIYHPDAGLMPSTERMAHVIEARNILIKDMPRRP